MNERERLMDRLGKVTSGISVPMEAITDGPSLQRNHIDGPLLHWAGHMHWLTIRERLALWFGLTTIDDIAHRRWPQLAFWRGYLAEMQEEQDSGR